MTIVVIKDRKSNKLIRTNALEYTILMINYATNTYYWAVLQKFLSQVSNPDPVVFINDDKTIAEAWTEKR